MNRTSLWTGTLCVSTKRVRKRSNMRKHQLVPIVDTIGMCLLGATLALFYAGLTPTLWLALTGVCILLLTTSIETVTIRYGLTVAELFTYKLVIGNTIFGVIGILFFIRSWAHWQLFLVAYTIGTVVALLFAWLNQVFILRHLSARQAIKVVGIFLGYYIGIVFF